MRPSTMVLVLLVMATTTCLAQSAMHNHIFPWYEFKRAEGVQVRRPASQEEYDVMMPVGGSSPQNEEDTGGEQTVPYSRVDRDSLAEDGQPLQNRLGWMYVCYNQKTGKWRFCRGNPGEAKNRVGW